MALSAVTSIGRVDLPPSFIGASITTGGQLKLSADVYEFTIQAADYSTGIAFSTIVAAINAATVTTPPTVPISATLTNIVGIYVLNVRVAAGTAQFGFGVEDVSGTKVRFFSVLTSQTSATDYTPANGDIWRVLVIGL